MQRGGDRRASEFKHPRPRSAVRLRHCRSCLLSALWVACLSVLALISPGMLAATFPLDDSASMVLMPMSQLRWRATGAGAQLESAADAGTQMRLVLNTQPWVAHSSHKSELSCSGRYSRLPIESNETERAMNTRRSDAMSDALNKVPVVTLGFWIIKIMSTTVGETGADYLAVNAGLGKAATSGAMAVFLTVSLIAQLRTRAYTPWIYWLTVVLVSVVGTQITDILTDGLGVSLYLSTAVFAALLAGIFAVWYRSERTLSILTISTRKRELFYWAAILCTFALGTAAGDLATEALGLGFQVGVVIFAALIGLIFVAYRFGVNPVLTFWLAYILTRPLGAALGDLLSQAKTYGGLGLGAMMTSVVFLATIIGLVAISQRSASLAVVDAEPQ